MFARTRISGFMAAALAVFMTTACQSPPGPGPSMLGQQQSRPAKATTTSDSTSNEAELTPAKIQATTYLAAARLHESEGHLMPAVQQYMFALKEDPTNTEALGRLGILYDRIGNGDAAEKAYKRALQIAPNDAYLHNNLAFSYIMHKKWSQAEAELNRAVEISPEFARARINLAMTLAQQNRFDEALKQFQATLPPEDAHYNMGLMYQSRRKMVEAAEEYKRALRANPKLIAAQEQLKRMPSATLSEADRRLEAEREAVALADASAVKSVPITVEPTTSPAAQTAGVLGQLKAGCQTQVTSVSPNDYLGAALASQMDSLLPPWQRSPEIVAELSMDYSWARSTGGCHWLDCAESPRPRLESIAAKTKTFATLRSSTQPE